MTVGHDFGVDEFGREHFVVEAPRGRLGISLGDNEQGFVVIRGLDALAASDMEAWEEIDRRRVRLMRQSVQVGDRIIAIEGDDVVHCSLKDIINRLGKLSAVKRCLTLARYHESSFVNANKYDIEKLVLARVPSGPLGLQINECITYGAFVDEFQRLPDGSMTKLAKNPQIHRGCQIINVNATDVSSMSRHDVVALLGSLKDQEKEVVFYRATSAGCASIFSVDSSASERHLGFTIDESESMRCVITSVGPRGDPSIGVGDILIGVNSSDVTTMPRMDAIALVKDSPLPRTLSFARVHEGEIPECHAIQIGPGPLGVNLDGEQRESARITSFTSVHDAERIEFKACAPFVAGSFFISIGHLDVSTHDLVAISGLLGKLKQTAKDIVIGNKAFLDIARTASLRVKIQVPKGPLGINFNGNLPESAAVAGFYRFSAEGSPGAIENSGCVAIGAVLQKINAMNVSCLSLTQVTDILKKLSDTPKELVFFSGDQQQDVNTRLLDVRLPSGPLGIDLKSSLANKVIVDKLNSDPSRGSTQVYDHGGVVEGSEIVAIDGFDVSMLELGEVLQLLKMLASHEKDITFSTTRAAYDQILDPTKRPGLVRLDLPGNMNIPFDTGVLDHAVLACDLQIGATIPSGSRIIGVEHVDVRCLTLQQLVSTMQSLQSAPQVCVVFDTTASGRSGSPSKPCLAEAVSSVLPNSATSSLKPATTVEGLRGSISQTTSAVDTTSSSPHVRPSLSTTDLHAFGHSPRFTPPSPTSRSPAASTPDMPIASVASPPSPRPSGSAEAPPTPPSLTAQTTIETNSSLARLSIRTMEATRPNADAAKFGVDKQPPTSTATTSEFLINMASWTGSRSLYRLVLDTAAQAITISPVKPTSPRPMKSGGTTYISFNEIVSLDCGVATAGTSPQKPSLFRSASSTLNTDGTERATVVLKTAEKKTIEFDMRSTDERLAFGARIKSLVPALRPPSSTSEVSLEGQPPRPSL